MSLQDKIRPVQPITTYPVSDVESAFRLLQSGKSIGKLVIVSNPDDQVKAIPNRLSNSLLHSSATYVIVGGTGGLGRSIARWMTMKGARYIVLLSRSGNASSKIQELADSLSKLVPFARFVIFWGTMAVEQLHRNIHVEGLNSIYYDRD